MLAIIGGSGIYDIPGLENPSPCQASNPYGDSSGGLVFGKLNGNPLLFLPRHGPAHNVPPHKINYRANIHCLKTFSATKIIALNTVGSLDDSLKPGDWVVPHQLVDYTWGREHTFFDGSGEGNDVGGMHVDFTEPYDEGLRQLLLDAIKAAGFSARDGAVYGCTQGPRLETAAEITRMSRAGCDLVGMTGMPEAALAREVDLAYASLSLVVNPAAGMGEGPITMEEINQVLTGFADRFMPVLQQLLTRIG